MGFNIEYTGGPTSGWDDIFGALNKAPLGPTPPSLTTFIGNIEAYAFSVNDEVFMEYQVPHSYKMGTNIFLHIHWTTDGVDTNTVKWAIEYNVGVYNPATGAYDFQVGNTTVNVESAGSGVAYRMVISSDPTGISGTLIGPSTIITARVKRVTNAGTDNTDVVFGFSADIHYQKETNGTFNPNFPFN